MPGITLSPGDAGEVMPSLSRNAGTVNSDDFWMIQGGGAIIEIIATDMGVAGSIDTLSIQAKNGDNYDTVRTFTGLAITAAGRYRFRISDNAAASTGSWKAVADDTMPVTGRLQVIHTVNAVVYSVNIHAIGS
jgi:hypothetical protein